jgi:predicted nucleotidyltransferase
MNADTWLERFKREVLPKIIAELKPEKKILFGSRIKGTADENSDIDVIVVSNAFANIPFIERMSLIQKMIRFPKHIETMNMQVPITERIWLCACGTPHKSILTPELMQTALSNPSLIPPSPRLLGYHRTPFP